MMVATHGPTGPWLMLMMRYQALFVAGFLEVYAFEYYKSDQIVVFDVACCDCAE